MTGHCARHPDILRLARVLHGQDAAAWRAGLATRAAERATRDAALESAGDMVARKRALMARYVARVRYRQACETQSLNDRVYEDLVAWETEARNAIAAEREMALTGAYHGAMEAARPDLLRVVEAALHRIVGDMDPPMQVAAVLDTALAEVVGRQASTLRAHPGTAAAVEEVLTARIGAGWHDMVTLERDPGLDRGALEVSTADGTAILTAARQVERIVQALADALPSPAEGDEEYDEDGGYPDPEYAYGE